MVNGWPIAHHVFPGNWHDFETVKGVVDDLEKRFGLKRVVFVVHSEERLWSEFSPATMVSVTMIGR